MTENSSENVKEEIIVDAGGTRHKVKVVENSQDTETLPRCKSCGKKIQSGWDNIEGYCRECWRAKKRGMKSLKGFEKVDSDEPS